MSINLYTTLTCLHSNLSACDKHIPTFKMVMVHTLKWDKLTFLLSLITFLNNNSRALFPPQLLTALDLLDIIHLRIHNPDRRGTPVESRLVNSILRLLPRPLPLLLHLQCAVPRKRTNISFVEVILTLTSSARLCFTFFPLSPRIWLGCPS